ncbi:hypothetical protein [Nostoc sp. CHAB 5715]|uniref:hypothetical protein n=1 Tax=Nostoc sp. CHAB 5715 TaxID=2780400 RepID=UPI001E3A31FD|nr:hypothetical protein [Nostoc sp. CHAB 5715]MCC5622793.1 hypothetical protein [Nostoc sp. CHAB 5715]
MGKVQKEIINYKKTIHNECGNIKYAMPAVVTELLVLSAVEVCRSAGVAIAKTVAQATRQTSATVY